MTHKFTQIAKIGLHQHMPMVLHQHKTIKRDIIDFYGAGQNKEKLLSIDIIGKNRPAFIAPISEMI